MLLIIGTVIGSGIFLVPGPVLRDVGGNVPLCVAAWLGGGLLSLLGALTYAELSAFRPASGGLYVYIRDCFGPLMAFLYGWTLLFLISGGSIATLAVGFGLYCNEIVPLGALGIKVVAVAMIAVATAINVAGTRKSANVQNWASGLKILALLALSIVLLCWGHHGTNAPSANFPGERPGAAGFGLAMISILWAFEGWQYCTFAAGETANPQRNLPRAFWVGSIALILLYLLANFAYLAALGVKGAANSNSIAAAAAATVIGPAASKTISIAILISMFSATNGMMLTSPRVYYAMAEDGLFFKQLAAVHPRFKTPAVAVISGAIWSMVLAVSGTFEQLLTYVVFSGWIFYALGGVAVFVYRRRFPREPRAFRVPGYPWTPALFVITAAWLVINTIVAKPLNAAIGLLLVLSGFPAYYFWRHRALRSVGVARPEAHVEERVRSIE